VPFAPPSFGLEVPFSAEKRNFNLVCGQYSTKGDVEDQEDEIDIRVKFGDKMEEFQKADGTIAQEFASYIALFDGHSGFHCSQFLADKLHQNLARNTSYPDKVKKALKAAYSESDKQFLEMAKSWGYDDGSSAYVVHIWKNTLFAASAGDSKGYLFTDGGEF